MIDLQLEMDLIGGASRAPIMAGETPPTEKKTRPKTAPNLALWLLPTGEWRRPQKWPWMAVNDRGEVWTAGPRMNRVPRPYVATATHKSGYKRVAGLHRSWIVCEAWHGPCPPGMEVCHGNGVPHDDRPSNLRWGTKTENGQDKADHGHVPGQKLTPADVPKIIRAKRRGTASRKIAARLGVSTKTVREIATGEKWNHVARRMKRAQKRPTRRQAVEEFPDGNNKE